MKPSNQTLFFYQGQTFADEFELVNGALVPLDLSGKTARMQVRSTIDSSVVIATFGTIDATIVLNNVGILRFAVPATVTAALSLGVFEVVQWVYDLELVTPGTPEVVERVMTGVIVFTPEITR